MLHTRGDALGFAACRHAVGLLITPSRRGRGKVTLPVEAQRAGPVFRELTAESRSRRAKGRP